MRVERELLHHPRFIKLKMVSGNPAALEWLIALWGYCQKQRASRFEDMSPDSLADACGAIIEGEKLLTFLVNCRWVKVEGKTLVVRKWEHWNAGLIQRWEAGQKAKESRLSTDKRPINDRSPSDRSVPRKMDGWIDRKRASARGEASGPGNAEKGRQPEKPRTTLRLIDQNAGGATVPDSVLDAAHDPAHPLPESERLANIKKFGQKMHEVANALRSDKPAS